jgi:hypothetical protein
MYGEPDRLAATIFYHAYHGIQSGTYRRRVIVRAALVAGLVSLVNDVAWNVATPAMGCGWVCENGSLAVGLTIWTAAGFVASRGVSIRSASAAAVLAFAIDAVVADMVFPSLVPSSRLWDGTEPWYFVTLVVVAVLLAAAAGAMGGFLARARRRRAE